MADLKIEAISPTEYSKIGSDYTIYYGFHNTIFGDCLIGVIKNSKNAICNLAFAGEEKDKNEILKVFKAKWHLSNLIENNKITKSVIDTIFDEIKRKKGHELNVLLKGTDFQITVWKALAQIPFGSCVTYAEVANMIQNPKAVRAVGSATGANQVGYLIPCHRVVCKNGCNKFGWGVKVKEKMQKFEQIV